MKARWRLFCVDFGKGSTGGSTYSLVPLSPAADSSDNVGICDVAVIGNAGESGLLALEMDDKLEMEPDPVVDVAIVDAIGDAVSLILTTDLRRRSLRMDSISVRILTVLDRSR